MEYREHQFGKEAMICLKNWSLVEEGRKGSLDIKEQMLTSCLTLALNQRTETEISSSLA